MGRRGVAWPTSTTTMPAWGKQVRGHEVVARDLSDQDTQDVFPSGQVVSAAHLEKGDIKLSVLMTVPMFLFLHPGISTCQEMQPGATDSCAPRYPSDDDG